MKTVLRRTKCPRKNPRDSRFEHAIPHLASRLGIGASAFIIAGLEVLILHSSLIHQVLLLVCGLDRLVPRSLPTSPCRSSSSKRCLAPKLYLPPYQDFCASLVESTPRPSRVALRISSCRRHTSQIQNGSREYAHPERGPRFLRDPTHPCD